MFSKFERLLNTIEEMEYEGKSDDEIFVTLEIIREMIDLDYERYQEPEETEFI
jgi:hypothetical protein